MNASPLPLAIVWHHHQPQYTDLARRRLRGSLLAPWVRLHGLRDYYGMAALLMSHPGVRLTVNFSPVLLEQLEAYHAGATDSALELTLTRAERLDSSEQHRLSSSFFGANWHTQIYPHARYAELLRRRLDRRLSGAAEWRDLQMWGSLAWFPVEMRQGPATLLTGEVVDVARFVRQGRDFRHVDIESMVHEQFKVLRAILPAYRLLAHRRQIEISASPYAHPILPLLLDTDQATIDRDGAEHPARFSRGEDVDAQIALGLDVVERAVGVRPHGMWPPEGAVSPDVVRRAARAGIRWLATDEGVLRQSGRWGYRADRVSVRARGYRMATGDAACALFFRDEELSNLIGFRYHSLPSEAAAADFLSRLQARAIALRDEADEAGRDSLVTVVLDGENAWGDFPDDGRPFLHALYAALEASEQVVTVTPTDRLDGDAARGIAACPFATLPEVHQLATASWIDEPKSRPGNDLGTWIGESDENLAWEYLGLVRDDLDDAMQRSAPDSATRRAIFAAEGSDWFWWFGDDQDSGEDDRFDALFFTHLRSAYLTSGRAAPDWLPTRLAARTRTWTFTDPVTSLVAGEALRIVTPCPGNIRWALMPFTRGEQEVMAMEPPARPEGRYHLSLGPFRRDARTLTFTFECRHPRCDGRGPCCDGKEWALLIEPERAER